MKYTMESRRDWNQTSNRAVKIRRRWRGRAELGFARNEMTLSPLPLSLSAILCSTIFSVTICVRGWPPSHVRLTEMGLPWHVLVVRVYALVGWRSENLSSLVNRTCSLVVNLDGPEASLMGPELGPCLKANSSPCLKIFTNMRKGFNDTRVAESHLTWNIYTKFVAPVWTKLQPGLFV